MKYALKKRIVQIRKLLGKATNSNNVQEDIDNMLHSYYLADKYKSKADDDFKNLQTHIQHGATSNNTITDFVILNHTTKPTNNALFAEEEKPYKTIDEKVTHNIGKAILIVEKKEVIANSPGLRSQYYIDPSYLKTETKYILGLISGFLKLDVRNGNIIFPTLNNHVESSYSGNKWDKKIGDIIIPYTSFRDLDKIISKRTTPIRNDLSENFPHEMKIYFGEEIDEFVKGTPNPNPLHEVIFGDYNEIKSLYEQGLKLLK